MFDPWVDVSPPLAATTGPIFRQVFSALLPKDRKARSDLVQGVSAIVPAIVGNLLKLHRERSEGSRLVMDMNRRTRTRYDRRGFRKLPEVLAVLEGAGWIVRHDAVFRQRRTTVEASDRLKQLLSGVSLSDIGRAEGEEIILLTARPEERRITGRRQPNRLVDYRDTEESIRLRVEMEEINRFLSAHSVVLEGSPQPAFRLYRIFLMRNASDPVHFDLHGRLYGGFWINLKATERQRLRIDGEPVADLDFASMFPHLAYRHVGTKPPPGDLYAVPGLEGYREGAKAGLSALLSYGSEMKSLPPRLKSKLPGGWTASRLKQGFAAHHPALVALFERDFGLDLMFTESRILLAAIRRLMAQRIPALPMHDGMMVSRSKAEYATEAMGDAAEEVIGIRLPISVKN